MLSGIFIHLISLFNEIFFSLPQISLFCIIYWTPTVKKHTPSPSQRDTEQWCTDTRIHLNVAKMQNQKHVQLDTRSWKGSWDMQYSCSRKETKQTAACSIMHKLQPCVHLAYQARELMLPYEDCKHITQPAFSPFSHDRLVRICIDVFLYDK